MRPLVQHQDDASARKPINHKTERGIRRCPGQNPSLYFLSGFVIMDIEEDTKIPFILGRPFMLTANYVVDMGNGNMEMSVKYQKVTFNIFWSN